MKEHFGNRLTKAIRKRKTPLVVGLDPRLPNLPDDFRIEGQRTDAIIVAAAYRQFCIEVIDLVASLVPAVKPQFAFFEQLGPAGFRALADVVKHARKSQLLVIGDAKRGDIGSTAIAYATAYLSNDSEDSICCDALTVNPYMGFDTLEPFAEVAQENGNGVFVLTKTSNPGSSDLQDLAVDSESIYERVGAAVQAMNTSVAGDNGYGPFGAVIGATYPQQLSELRAKMPNTYFLIPGFGAQGGSAADAAGGMDEHGLGAIVNSSRGIIFAYENEQYSGCEKWTDAVRQATLVSIEALKSHTPAGNLA